MYSKSRPLKVLHILDHSLPVHSGYAFRSHSLMLAQKQRGWDPIVLTSPKHYESFDGEWARSEQIDEICYQRTRRVPKTVLPIASELRLMVELAKRIESIVQRERPDVLHAHSPILNAMPALWVGQKFGLPTVYELRALWEDAAVDHGTYSNYSWKYRLVRCIETWVCRKASHVTVISDGLRRDLISRGVPPNRITVIPNGVNVEVFRPVKPDISDYRRWNPAGKRVIGFIGSFFRYEGLDVLIDAISQLRSTRSDITALLIGGGEMEADLKTQIVRLHLEKDIVMVRSIPHREIPRIYSVLDILIYPRHSMRLTELVTPLKPLEAMAMGKTVMASDVGGHCELIQNGHTGFLFKAGSASALAEGLELLLNDNDLRQKLGTHAADWIRQNRSWDKTTTGYGRVYSEIL